MRISRAHIIFKSGVKRTHHSSTHRITHNHIKRHMDDWDCRVSRADRSSRAAHDHEAPDASGHTVPVSTPTRPHATFGHATRESVPCTPNAASSCRCASPHSSFLCSILLMILLLSPPAPLASCSSRLLLLLRLPPLLRLLRSSISPCAPSTSRPRPVHVPCARPTRGRKGSEWSGGVALPFASSSSLLTSSWPSRPRRRCP
jgi:hypothetical protein